MDVHNWDVTPSQAIEIQTKLRKRIKPIKDWEDTNIKIVAGVDVSFPSSDTACAAIVNLSFPSLNPIEVSLQTNPVKFPYVPGLLAFREGEVVIKAYEALENEPDLIIFDAQGYAHPRRLGLASHIGILLNKPSIGCAKSKLIGKIEPNMDLVDKGEIIGKVVKTKENLNPLFVSIGHRINLDTAVRFVLTCTKKGSRLPQTTILAHKAAAGEDIKVEESKESEGQQSLF